MTWLAIADRNSQFFAANGISNSGKDAISPEADLEQVLETGSLLMETRLSPYDRPQLLLGLERAFEHALKFSIRAIPGAGVHLVHSRGKDVFHGVLSHDSLSRTDILRITYSWDMRHRKARLAVERPDNGKAFQVILDNPLPITLSDVRELTKNRALRSISEDVFFFAVSDRIEPIGPMPGMTASTPVATPFGYRAMGDLKRGDLVETLNGNMVPVLQVVRRTVPAKGLFEPVRLRTPYFGLVQDMVVAPEQRLVIGGSRVEYMFGAEHVLVPARHLVNGSAAIRETNHALVTYTQVLLPDHEAIHAAGTFIESFNIGRIRRKRDLLRSSLLSQFEQSTLPEHSTTAFPVLRSFEALVLAEQRAA
ncbi:Hint domain-containing protein [Shimia thalassica]|uniref:Hint domain-containing protein n=1 Tax=Shimia thalassica TaxID=1715693 RepID=UPI0026E14453|nr:Hint domain-containing protein [Shimia thalassica]MDO6523034.1 Hint domain-containing protein [Shimia thalassica]